MTVRIGTVLHGYCQGYFGRDGLGKKWVEFIGADWIVVRHENGNPNFACACAGDDWEALLEKWAHDEDKT